MSCAAPVGVSHPHSKTHLNAFRNAMKTAPDSVQCTPQGELNAFRNAMKTEPVHWQRAAPSRARVSRVSTSRRSQEPIPMGSWLFSTSHCRI
jgi:hypothetical protein